MRAAADAFSGMKDFRSFTDDDADEKSTIVAIERIEIAEDGDLVIVRVEGSHFLWKMVRRMVGVMVDVGIGGTTVEKAATFLREDSNIPAQLPRRHQDCSWSVCIIEERPGAPRCAGASTSDFQGERHDRTTYHLSGVRDTQPASSNTDRGAKRCAVNARLRCRRRAALSTSLTRRSQRIEKSATPVLLDLWADWCGPCHILAPTVDQLSTEMAGLVKVGNSTSTRIPAPQTGSGCAVSQRCSC